MYEDWFFLADAPFHLVWPLEDFLEE
jgi:hypothetical protein